ncbi:BON domain-containing protein [Rhizobium glycinendophyticum]|uniref:BON domain-containing protein n=1 Tax=Rhizobium glycinendophyticum TaxID=2589807 RepID=A0A504UKG1_9HYPH|nr:BON domain-containing protein [Rhizobium glycinendophyticum]TPP11205.1 BON domain-containing protein [Rhizobium glycinendophyticum]
MAKDDRKTDFSTEEEFRDDDQRNIADGWPYADGEGATAAPIANRGYGETGANFDQDRNQGFRVDNVNADGFEPEPAIPVLPTTDGREDDDQLESDVATALEDFDDVVLNGLDIHVDAHVVTLRGAVDTAEERRKIELKVLGVTGVSQVKNFITTLGVDSHIPDED